jgi:hypothetical protein
MCFVSCVMCFVSCDMCFVSCVLCFDSVCLCFVWILILCLRLWCCYCIAPLTKLTRHARIHVYIHTCRCSTSWKTVWLKRLDYLISIDSCAGCRCQWSAGEAMPGCTASNMVYVDTRQSSPAPMYMCRDIWRFRFFRSPRWPLLNVQPSPTFLASCSVV